MEINHTTSESKGTFYIGTKDALQAEMTYSKAGDSLIIIDHTEVDESLRGTGAGKALVNSAVEYARANNLKIIPLCPFANAVFKKNPAYADVLK